MGWEGAVASAKSHKPEDLPMLVRSLKMSPVDGDQVEDEEQGIVLHFL